MNNARLTHAHGTVISILRELSLSPLGNLALDGDAVVLDKILHDTEKAPVVVVLRVFRENLKRASLADIPSVLAELAAVEHDKVLHRVESSRSLVGVNERLAHLGLPLHVHTGVIELLEVVVKVADDILATLYRQTMFAEFELLVHEEAEKGNPINVTFFRETYRKGK